MLRCWVLAAAFVWVAMIFPCVTSAQSSPAVPSPAEPFQKVALESNSSILIKQLLNFGLLAPSVGKPLVLDECIVFRNLERRTATEVTFHFRYYNSLGNHNGDDVLTRRGKFSTGVDIVGMNQWTQFNPTSECVKIHYPRDGISLLMVWVQSVKYDDGTAWAATDLQLPDRLPNWHPAVALPTDHTASDVARTIAQNPAALTQAAVTLFTIDSSAPNAALLRPGDGVITVLKSERIGNTMLRWTHYQYMYADGNVESDDIPWPFVYPVKADPFARGVHRIPIEAPPANFKPDRPLKPVLQRFFDGIPPGLPAPPGAPSTDQ